MKEKENKMVFTSKEAKYLKEYYKEYIIGKVIYGSTNLRLYEINIIDSNKGMKILQVKGTQLNQSNIHLEIRIESLIETLNLENPKVVLGKM